MTEQEWLEQSDYEKNLWIRNIFHKAATSWKDLEYKDYLNWQGFGLGIKDLGDKSSWHLRKLPTMGYRFRTMTNEFKSYYSTAPTPWEALYLVIGKMKGLIEEYAEK